MDCLLAGRVVSIRVPCAIPDGHGEQQAVLPCLCLDPRPSRAQPPTATCTTPSSQTASCTSSCMVSWWRRRSVISHLQLGGGRAELWLLPNDAEFMKSSPSSRHHRNPSLPSPFPADACLPRPPAAYYFFTTIGISPWWGRNLTQLQMGQFITMNVQAITILLFGCPYPNRVTGA